jgi:hypothetical protein
VPAVLPLIATLPLQHRLYINSTTGFLILEGHLSRTKDGKLREDTGSVKIDFLQNDKSSFSARYNINDSDTDTPYGVGTDQTRKEPYGFNYLSFPQLCFFTDSSERGRLRNQSQ